MLRRLPPLNPLRAFETAARHLSMSRAADELNVTHGAVSHQVRSLEKTLMVPLFIRDGTRLQLSAHGAALFPSVTHAFGSIAEAVALLTAPTTEGDLVVSCLPSLMTFWLIPRLDRFSDRYPGIRMRLISSNDKRRVLAQDIDIWITYGNDGWPDREAELWLEPLLFPVCSPALINSRPVRSVEDLRGHTLLHSDDGREWSDWLSAAGAPELACGRRRVMSDAQLATQAAIHGHGIALCDSLSGTDLLSGGRLVVPIDLKIPASLSFYIVYRHELQGEPIVRAFIDWIFGETRNQSALSVVNAAAPVKHEAVRRKTRRRRTRRAKRRS